MIAMRTRLTVEGFKAAVRKLQQDKREPTKRRIALTKREPADLIRQLRERADAFAPNVIAAEMEVACKQCGLSRAEGICADCPLVAVITRLLGMALWQLRVDGVGRQ